MLGENAPDAERSAQAVKSQWGKMQHSVQKFCGFYRQAELLNQSGKSEDDVLSDAEVMYLAVQKESFAYLEPWRVLRNHPKWQITSEPSKRPREPSDDGEGDKSEGFSTPVRPTGVKAAKLAKEEERRSKKEADSAER